MATFTEAQITDLAEILSTNSSDLSYHLDAYEGVITDSDKTRVLAKVTEWQAIDTDFAKFEPKESNEGFQYDPGVKRAALVQRIATLVQWPVTTTSNRLTRA